MGTVIGDLLRSIVSTFKLKYPEWIKKTYAKIPEEIKKDISVFIKIADEVDQVLQSDLVQFAAKLTPWDLDDDIIEFLNVALPKWISEAKQLTGGDKALLVANLTAERLDTTLDQALITSQVVYRESKQAD